MANDWYRRAMELDVVKGVCMLAHGNSQQRDALSNRSSTGHEDLDLRMQPVSIRWISVRYVSANAYPPIDVDAAQARVIHLGQQD